MQSNASSDGLRKPQIAFVFCFHPGFQILRGFFLLPQELLDARQRAPGGIRPCFNGLVGAIEIVPGDGFHIGAKNEIGVAFPNLELMLLRGTDGAADNLKNVCRGAQITILHSHRYTKDGGCAKFARRACRNGRDETAVRQAARADLHRFEQARKRATGANGVHQIPLRKYDRLAGRQVRRDRCKRNTQIFKLSGFENALDQFSKTIVAGKAEPGNSPPSDVTKAKSAASRNDARKRCAARVSGAKNAAHTRSCDMRNGDFIFFENLQNTEVREPTRESASKSEPKPCPGGRGG
jgi:hypothetical protein